MTTEEIAQVTHEANRAYCETIGDYSQPEWRRAPQWQKDSAVDSVRYHLSHPDASPSHSHDCWLAEKKAAGWKYGPVKDASKKEHFCMVPFNELPFKQQAKDYLFAAVVNGLRNFEG